MAKCRSCGSGGGGGINSQGFQQATMQGNQINPGLNPAQGTTFTKGPTGSALKGSPGYFASNPTQTPQQLEANNSLISQIMPLLQQIQGGQGRYAGFEPIEQENRNRWNNEVMPSIAQNFVNMTGDSQFGGGGYAGQLGKAYNQSAVGLGALKAQYGLQNQGQQQQLLSLLMNSLQQPQFQTNYIDPTKGILESPVVGRLIGGGIGAAAGGLFGGPAGALAGASVGSGLGNLASNK